MTAVHLWSVEVLEPTDDMVAFIREHFLADS
jgi:hypothetical protein